MGFSCDCDDAWDISRVSYQNARKQYTCHECREPIPVGAYYRRFWGVWCGDPETHLSCERCSDLISSFGELGFCWTFGSFLNDYAEWLELEGKKQPAWLVANFNERDKRRALAKSRLEGGS